MVGPLGLWCVCGPCSWPAGPGYWNLWPVGPQRIECGPMGLWAGNAGAWSSEFFSAKQRSQRLLSRLSAAERNAPPAKVEATGVFRSAAHTLLW